MDLLIGVVTCVHACVSCFSRNEDSKRLSKSFKNFILSQVNSNMYMNHVSRSIRMNGQTENPCYITSRVRSCRC